jgi:predicted nucleotidyltransferase component of viral defense system
MLNKELHRKYMFLLIQKFSKNITLSQNLALKWWTLSYFLYGLDRFSTDLDFDIIWSEKQENIYQEVKNILLQNGFIKEEYNKRYTIFFLFSYNNMDMNIKIELNKRIWKWNKYITQNFFGTDIRAMDKWTVFANKLVALTDRNKLANRDIYDIYFFYKNNFPINKDIILERTWKEYKEYLSFLKIFLSKLKWINILDWLGWVLTEKQRFFVKNNLMKELLGIIDFELNFDWL